MGRLPDLRAPAGVRICLVTPAPPGSTSGNRVTATRWAGLLRELGHRVTVAQRYTGQPCDMLVALHARKSHAAVARFRRERPGAPVTPTMSPSSTLICNHN